MRRVFFLIVAICVFGVAACVALLPEGYVVNTPIRGLLFGAEPPPPSELQRRIQLPPGFRIDTFATGIRNARFMRFTATGDLLVSSPREGAIFLLEPDRDGDGASDSQRVLIGDLRRPHGLDFHGDWLYIAEVDGVRRVRYEAETQRLIGGLESVITELPDQGNHWTKTLRFGEDGWMYVSIGSSCNVCIEGDPRRATLVRYQPDGSNEQIFARGLRNAVGFDFHPETREIWATDNGRDLLGDDFPPCEFNRVVQGGFYGWPFANGSSVIDPDVGSGHEAEVAASISPEHSFVAHTAPLGMTFYRGEQFPERYRRAAFVAQHGSWNRSTKSGYRVVMLEWDSDGKISESDFVIGFELDEDVIGRPVDVIDGPDGALYITDDYTGAVYRVSYSG